MDSDTKASAPTLYQILGVEETASSDESAFLQSPSLVLVLLRVSPVRRAYKTKALETHPDKLEPNASPEEKQASEARFHEVRGIEIAGLASLIDETGPWSVRGIARRSQATGTTFNSRRIRAMLH